MRRLFLKAAGAVAAGAALHACGGGGSDDSDTTSVDPPDPNTGTGSSNTALGIARASAQHTLLVRAVERAGLTSTLSGGSGMTVFAPTNTAFDELASRIGLANGDALISALTPNQWAAILKFHVVPSEQLSGSQMLAYAANDTRPVTLYAFQGDVTRIIFVNESGPLNIWDGCGRSSITLGQTDIAASNGVVHVINDVMLPRGVLTVSQMIRANFDSMSRFAASLNGSRIAELDAAGPFTLFVPADPVLSTTLPDNVVLNHIVAGQTLGSGAFPASVVLTTRANVAVTLRNVSPLATLSYGTSVKARITDVDFFASNGVYHVIDAVMLPS